MAFLQDLRYALRVLGKSPGLTLVIIFSLGIGIGANTAVFSVADALLLKPLPYPHPDRLAILWLRSPGIGIPEDWPSPGQYLDVRQGNRSFEEMAICIGDHGSLITRDHPERIEMVRASSSLMSLFGAQPFLGRIFTADDDASGKKPVALLTHGLWNRLFNADPNIVGRDINLDGRTVTVAGVLRPDFLLNHEVVPTVAGIDKAEMLISLPMAADAQQKQRGDENYNVLARLRPGVTFQKAQADVDVIAGRIRDADKRDRTFTISVVPLQEQVVGNVKRSLLVLLGSVALVLLIACANVANLLLSRASGRQKEVAIRTALGAGARVVRQLLTESVLLGLLGGAAGVGIAALGLAVMRAIHPGNIPRLETITLDAGVLAFTFAISIITGVVFGLAPALRAIALDLNSALKAGGRASQGAGGFHIGRHRLRGLLVVTESAFSLILLIGAGLLVRSFLRLQQVPPGFNPDHVISAQLALSGPKYRDGKVTARTFQEILDRISHLPGVNATGAVSTLPFTSSVSWGGIQIEGYVPPPTEPELQVDKRTATSDYFRAMEIPLIAGRTFNEYDTIDAPRVAVIDQKMAKRFWPRESPLGKRVRGGGSSAPWVTIVGVAGTVKQYGLDQDLRMVVYYPHAQQAFRGMYLVARTVQDPATLVSAISREAHAVEPDAPVYAVSTMSQRISDSLARERFSTTMLAAFAAFAMLLGGIGIYGVMSYLVTQGTHDLGVRIALGASRGSILNLVVRQGMSLAGIGIVLGLAGALALTRVMSALLFGVSATDAATFTGVALFVAAIALVASYIPAWRATRVDPLVALREE